MHSETVPPLYFDFGFLKQYYRENKILKKYLGISDFLLIIVGGVSFSSTSESESESR
jgi:hypothetical protein